MARIKIPVVPRTAYNDKRGASDLLVAQIANLETALGRRPARRKGRLTEGEAAAFIRHLSRHLHHRVLLGTMPIVATPVGLALRTKPGPVAKTPKARAQRKKR